MVAIHSIITQGTPAGCPTPSSTEEPPSPNLHTVAASLRTVDHPPVALQAIYFHPSGQSTVRFDSLCSGPVQNLHKQKKRLDILSLKFITVRRASRASSAS